MNNYELVLAWCVRTKAGNLRALRTSDPLHIGNNGVLYSYNLPIACYSHKTGAFFVLNGEHPSVTQTTSAHINLSHRVIGAHSHSVQHLPYDHLNEQATSETHTANTLYWTESANNALAAVHKPRTRLNTKHRLVRHYLHLARRIEQYAALFKLPTDTFTPLPPLRTVIPPALYAQLVLEYGPEDTWAAHTN